MKKSLPIGQPDITSYGHHANLLAICNGLLSDIQAIENWKVLYGNSYEDIKMNWFCTNYVQIQSKVHPFDGEIPVDFAIGYQYFRLYNNFPLLVGSFLGYDLIASKWNDICDFVIDSINANNYVYIEVDEFHISHYRAYQKYHLMHQMLIYGYDSTLKQFFIADFFSTGKYSFQTCSFSELKNSFCEMHESHFFNGVGLYKQSMRWTPYPLNIELVKQNFLDYLNSNNTDQRNLLFNSPTLSDPSSTCVYGLSVYDNIIEKISYAEHIDHRSLFLLYDHKNLMKKIVMYLFNKGYLSDAHNLYSGFDVLSKQLNTIYMLCIKFNLTHNKDILLKITNQLQEIMNKEKLLFTTLYTSISDKPSFPFNSQHIVTDNVICNFWERRAQENFCNISGPSYFDTIFIGDNFSYYAATGPSYGTARVVIDGKFSDEVNLFSNHLENDKLVYENQIFYGIHQVTVTASSQENINITSFRTSSSEHQKSIFCSARVDNISEDLPKMCPTGFIKSESQSIPVGVGFMLSDTYVFSEPTGEISCFDNYTEKRRELSEHQFLSFVNGVSIFHFVTCGDSELTSVLHFKNWKHPGGVPISLTLRNGFTNEVLSVLNSYISNTCFIPIHIRGYVTIEIDCTVPGNRQYQECQILSKILFCDEK